MTPEPLSDYARFKREISAAQRDELAFALWKEQDAQIKAKGMTRDRWRHLNKTGEALTPKEIAAGWHYCHDWDGLLIHPGDPEAECCSCRPEADQSPEPATGD